MAGMEITSGQFENWIPYVRLGSGPRKLAFFSGGPGSMLPSGLMLRMMARTFKPFTEDHTVYMMSRRSDLPRGYSTRDMSEDYAAVISGEVGGPVAVIGTSYGGLIAQHFAADHPDLITRLVLASAAYEVSPAGKELDTRVASLQSRGRWGAAYAAEMAGIRPERITRYLMAVAMHLLFIGKRRPPAYPTDPLVEAEAEANHTTRDRLSEIEVPTLVIGGGSDFFFPAETLRETAAGILNARLVLYEGMGHAAGFDKRVNRDILAFLRG